MDRLEYEKQLTLHSKKYRRPSPKLIKLPESHPFYSMAHKGYVAESRLVMAEHIGRPLTRDELVCFKDDFPLNTDISNLELKERRDLRSEAIEYGTNSDFAKSERYLKGKVEEKRIAIYLASTGYHIVDISLNKWYQPSGTIHYSPFDIMAWSENFSFLADVKYRSSRGPVFFRSNRLSYYLFYWFHLKVDDRIIIIATPGLPDSFISLTAIKETCPLDKYDMCVIDRDKLQSIAVLRKKLDGKA